MEDSRERLGHVLKLSAFSVLFARAVQHIFFDVPYRAILWNEDLLLPLFNFIKIDWQEYVTSSVVDSAISVTASCVGVLLLGCSVVALFSLKKARFALVISSLYLGFLAFLIFIEKFFVIAQFFEYSIQVISPFCLYYYWKNGVDELLLKIIRVGIALTFFGHGAYALGIFPTPGNFLDMVITILNCSESTAVVFLKIMGSLDFLAGALLFFRPTRNWAYAFCFIWGLFTSLARVLEFNSLGVTHVMAQYAHELIMRGPHFLMPLFLILSIPQTKKDL
ncbi:hypothetical protein [Halobacteriovorax sp. HLS]|uniref:hypothetical protein n=1 Tax=Halobacteriovorax sp. HLS TaxID=2234000 RepID=UPI000FDA3F20|nr:hypothetical protein [Halobacteriovorax sp. HLS]